MLQAALPASWLPCRPRDIHRRRSPATSARLRVLWRGHAPGGWWRPICSGRPHRAAGMPRHLPLRPRRQRGRALGRAPDDPASGQPTTTPCSDRHLAVAVRRGSTPRYGSPRQRPRRAARAGRARSAGSQGMVQSGSAGEEPNRDGCSHGRDRVGDSGRDVCNECEADAAGEQDDELHMLWPGIGIGARRSWRDEGRSSERSHANTRRGRSGRRRTVTPTGEADR